MTPVTKLSVAEFHRLEGPEEVRCELDEGELIQMTKPRLFHNRIAGRVRRALESYMDQHAAGEVLDSDNGYVLAPETIRCPDVSVLMAARAAAVDPHQDIPGAPDLAVEVLSPNDSMSAVDRKVRQYLDAGCRVVWLVDPEVREVMVYRAGSDVIERRRDRDDLTEPELLPGFSLRVSELF